MQQSDSPPAITVSGERRKSDRRLLIFMASGHGTTHWYAGLLSVILPVMARDLDFSYTQVGLLMTGRALLSACGNIATSMATDLGGRRKGILVGSVGAVALCYVLLGFATELYMVVLFGSLAAMAANAWHPPAMSLLGERFPKRRGYALGWHGTGANLGQAISPLVAGAILAILPWRQTLYVNVLPGLLMMVMLIWRLPALDDDRLPRQAEKYWGRLRDGLIQNPALLKVGVLSVLRMMGQQTIQTFLPLYLAYELQFSTTLVGIGLGLMTFSGSVIEPFSGMLSDRIGRKPVLFTCLFLACFTGWGLTLVSGVLVPILFVGLIGLLHFSLRSIMFAFAMDVTPPDIAASTVGFVFTINHIFSALAPVLIGYLADLYGLRIVFYVFAGLSLLAAFWVPLTARAAVNPPAQKTSRYA
jgi:MFS family permease